MLTGCDPAAACSGAQDEGAAGDNRLLLLNSFRAQR